MLFLFIILVIISAAAASISFFVYRRKSLPPHTQDTFDSPNNYRSLFAPDEEELRRWQKEEDEKELAERQTEFRQNLLRRAAELDYNALLEAKVFGNSLLYDEIFQILLQNDSHKLTDFVTRNGLTANAGLVELSAKKLSETPALDNLIKFVQLSALTNSAEIFLQSIETTSDLWKKERLNKISGEKLIEILDSHYWLLATDARISGAGYLLKDRLASVRREILESNH
jgi:hypothetical protein